ncbi:unnamed protein product [Boreogadus saida]
MSAIAAELTRARPSTLRFTTETSQPTLHEPVTRPQAPEVQRSNDPDFALKNRLILAAIKATHHLANVTGPEPLPVIARLVASLMASIRQQFRTPRPWLSSRIALATGLTPPASSCATTTGPQWSEDSRPPPAAPPSQMTTRTPPSPGVEPSPRLDQSRPALVGTLSPPAPPLAPYGLLLPCRGPRGSHGPAGSSLVQPLTTPLPTTSASGSTTRLLPAPPSDLCPARGRRYAGHAHQKAHQAYQGEIKIKVQLQLQHHITQLFLFSPSWSLVHPLPHPLLSHPAAGASFTVGK